MSVHRGKWSQLGVPHRGWTCEATEDLGEPSRTCEMCETQNIRYVHYMRHPDYPFELACGCDCAGHMEDDLVGAEQREGRMRAASGRRKRWPDFKGWHLSRAGNPTITKDGYRMALYRNGSGWAGLIVDLSTEAKTNLGRPYPDLHAAKLAAFDRIVFSQKKPLR